MTSQSLTAAVKSSVREGDMAALRSFAMPMRRYLGLLLVALAIVIVEVTGRPLGLDPAVLVPMAVLAGAAVDGLIGGGLAGGAGGLYMALYYTSPIEPVAGGPEKILLGLAATALALLVAAALRDRVADERRRAGEALADEAAVTLFAEQLGREPPQTIQQVIVDGLVGLLDADMGVLTVLDPSSGQHIVRAGDAGNRSAIGVGVMPGVGITGQAIRDMQLIVSVGGARGFSVGRLQRRLAGRASAQSIVAMPCLHAGQVIACVTLGRSDGAPFGPAERHLLHAVAPLISLALTGSLLGRENDGSAPWPASPADAPASV